MRRLRKRPLRGKRCAASVRRRSCANSLGFFLAEFLEKRIDRHFRIADDVCEQYLRDFKLDLFSNRGSHLDSHGNAQREDILKHAAESREESGFAMRRPKDSIEPQKVISDSKSDDLIRVVSSKA